MGAGRLVGSGRTADVFALDDAWVLRRYRDGGDAATEAAVMAYLAERGVPVPRVRTDDALVLDASTDLVMRRLFGPTMLVALRRGEVTGEFAGTVLGDLLRRLHAVPARVSADPADRVLHLDLHPDNVLLTADGPMLVDWRNSTEGPPALDWAMSAVVLAQAAVGPTDDAAPARDVLDPFLANPACPLTPGGPSLTAALRRRAADPSMTADETRLLGAASTLIDTRLTA